MDEDDDDGRMLTISTDEDPHHSSSSSSSSSSPTAHPTPMLDLSLAADMKSRPHAHAHDQALHGPLTQEESILVTFDLPDGSQGEGTFKLGQTVEYLKSYVESEYGIPIAKQTLYLHAQAGEDKATPMLNPLSLLDFRECKGVDEIVVRVDGPLGSEFRK